MKVHERGNRIEGIDFDEIPRASIVTLGCPMNQVDSQAIIKDLIARGFEIVNEDSAHVIIVNTCGFIRDACEESIDTILELSELKKTGVLRALVVAGCLAERFGKELERELIEADAVFGLKERDKIGKWCAELLGLTGSGSVENANVVSGPEYSAYLKIAEGCDNRCTYCTIPYIRGPYISKDRDMIVKEAEELARIGKREIVLIAQDTTCYGKGSQDQNLELLLKDLSKVEGIEWIRLMYTHPDNFSDRLIETIGDTPKVLPYIDMPIQHISGSVLKRMGRRGNPVYIKNLIEKLRVRIKGLVLRTSLIVGFPGEEKRDFEKLCDFVAQFQFERLGAFIFSPESGTPAFKMDMSVSPETASERLDRLMEIQAGVSDRFHSSLKGRIFDMIIDKLDTENGSAMGRIYMDAPEVDCCMHVRSGVRASDVFRRVRITGTGPYDLEGELV